MAAGRISSSGAEDFSSSPVVGGRLQSVHCHRRLSLPGPHAAATPSREASKEDRARRQKPDCSVS